MKVTNIHPHSKGVFLLVRRTTILVAAAILLLAGTARAADVTVVCPGGTPPDFPSITDALAALDLIGPHTITVTGTCAGNVRIVDRDRVTIQAAAGDTATIVGTGGIVVRITGARRILLRRLTIHGGGPGVWVTRASLAEIRGSTIENNTGTGLRVRENSTVLLGGSSAEDSVQISDNGGSGIDARRSVLKILGSTTVEKNGAVGVRFLGASASFAGENFIRDNGGMGVSVSRGSDVSFTGSTTIEYNTTLGMNVAGSTSVTMSGPHKIRNNGTLGLTGRFRGGIRVGTTSRIEFSNGTEVTDNIGSGLLVEFNASVALSNTSITNNSEDGLRVVRGAVGFIGSAGGIGIAGNGGANIFCDSTALVAAEDLTDLAGIPKINCMRIERTKGPPRPGHINEEQ
jgi:hypothetical protein